MLDEVDGDLLFTTGASQGGGLSLVTAALSPRVKGAVSMCPSYTCIRNRMEDRTGVLTQITKHVEQHPGDAELIYDNVSYFDALNFAADIKVETLIGIMMNDPICLPRYVYSAYMQLRCKKELLVSPAGHKVTPEAARQGLRFLERLIRSGKRT